MIASFARPTSSSSSRNGFRDAASRSKGGRVEATPHARRAPVSGGDGWSRGLFLDGKPSEDGGYLFNAPPALGGNAPDNATDEFEKGVFALAHGMPGQYAPGAIARGELWSAALRVGPKGDFARDADKRGGGVAAVYTRAITRKIDKWQACGFGVGSNSTKAQLLISPVGLLGNDDSWHASTMDNMGFAPGAKKANATSAVDAWKAQGRDVRHRVMKELIHQASGAYNNELMHWERLVLRHRLMAVIVTGDTTVLNEFRPPKKPEWLQSELVGDHTPWAPRIANVAPCYAVRVGGDDGHWTPIYHIKQPTANVLSGIRALSAAFRERHT